MADPLHARFDAAMMDTYHRAKRECQYNATYFLQLLHELGGVETAKRLLASDNPAAGLTTLWECGRLDLSVEAKVLLPEFGSCFARKSEQWRGRGWWRLGIKCKLILSSAFTDDGIISLPIEHRL